MRNTIDINNDWYFKAPYVNGMEVMGSIDKSFEKVNLPHANVELPYNYFDEKDFQIETCYKYPLIIPEEFKNKIIYAHFEGVMAYAKVYLNGVFLGDHKGGYTPFDIRIDEQYNYELNTNVLTVLVDSREISDIPPFGGQIDYLTYGGIYREVSIGIYDEIFIKNVKVEPHHVLEREKNISLKVYLENLKQYNGKAHFKVSLKGNCEEEIYNGDFEVDIKNTQNVYNFEISNLKNIKLWDIDSPNMYEICVSLTTGKYSDQYSDAIGFRIAEFTPHGFYLNGKKLKIRGLNRHQAYPYVGYAMPKRVQEKDADILKNELHLNLVRTSHYPQSKHFLKKCDKLGLMVFEEIPGWQHIGNEEWKKVAKDNVREMIERDWNHPSIILWGVRINESKDDDLFYKETNRIAHELDGTRQTGGVRCNTNSNLLEDVYTFNDFIHDGNKVPLREQQLVTGLNINVPYMVTEFNGHMYPTKRFDQEERQMEHSLRHLRVQNASYLDESISGAIGWCAFDYNTHKDFGAGDRICYHGVMDMFRLPKFAAAVYSSQVKPEVEPVLEPVTFWARGERSIGGIIPLVIFTNCDYIEFQYGNQNKKKIYADREEYRGIPFPPIIIDYSVISEEAAGAWGMDWEDASIKGYYNNEVIIERKLCRDPLPSELYVSIDDNILNSSEKDATRIIVKILDQCGNPLPFIDEIIKVEVIGPGRIQGPSEIVVKGGVIAFWLETLNIAGNVDILIKSRSLGQKKLGLKIV